MSGSYLAKRRAKCPRCVSGRLSSRGQLERSWTCCTSGCTSVRGMTCSGSWASLGPRSHFPNFHRAIGRLKGFVPGPGASAGHRRDRRQQWAAGGGWKAESPASWLAIRRIFNSVFNWKVFKAKLATPQDVVWPRLWVFNGGCKRPDTGDCFAGNPPACDFSYCEQLKSSLPGPAHSYWRNSRRPSYRRGDTHFTPATRDGFSTWSSGGN